MTDLDQKTELEVLKTRARTLGIKFSNNISVSKLRAKIEAATSDTDEDDEEEPAEEKKLTRQQMRDKQVKEQMRLVRLRISNLDPKKRDLHGEIITVANKYVGTVRKFIPFGEATDNGYHVPYILYEALRSRRFLDVKTIKDKKTGHLRTKTQYVREFALEELPPLTEEELADLAKVQAASGSLRDED